MKAIQDYFDGLLYSGNGHIDNLVNCINLVEPKRRIDVFSNQELLRHYFKRWLYACYLCSTGKMINDIMLIFIGKQGIFKTSFLNYLTPKILEDYRVCSHIDPSLTDRRTTNFLAEKFFINVDDQMDGISREAYVCMDIMVSSIEVINRKRRIANFCASTNDPIFLNCYNSFHSLCFEIDKISPDYRNIDINSVWAEVKHEADKINCDYIFDSLDYSMIFRMNEIIKNN